MVRKMQTGMRRGDGAIAGSGTGWEGGGGTAAPGHPNPGRLVTASIAATKEEAVGAVASGSKNGGGGAALVMAAPAHSVFWRYRLSEGA